MNRIVKLHLLLVMLSPFQLFSQIEKEMNIDTSSVIFKAKLFTISRYDVASEKKILKSIKEQEATILPSLSDNLLFIKIKFGQKPYNTSEVFGDCSYYLAFNSKIMKFYKLGGFDSNDAVQFFNDLASDDLGVYLSDSIFESEIDFPCLIDYIGWSQKKKRKKGCNCHPKCSNELFQEIIIH